MKNYKNFLSIFLALTLIFSSPGLANLVTQAYASVNVNDVIGGYLDGVPWPWPSTNPDPTPPP
ncbi:MAG TPA: hypothetical protein VD815_06485, partial [Candidatus Saccharimonadales bacterium]|nr:hypothetical protein [Candidatus Saccharimonadales bacterium]